MRTTLKYVVTYSVHVCSNLIVVWHYMYCTLVITNKQTFGIHEIHEGKLTNLPAMWYTSIQIITFTTYKGGDKRIKPLERYFVVKSLSDIYFVE